MKLRPYQVEMCGAIIQGFTENKPFIAQASVGAGKSIIIAEVAKRLGKPLLVLCPNKEILEQDYAKMKMYDLPATLYSASVNSKEIGHITLATIQSIWRKPQDFAHFEYCCFDEADLFSLKGKMYIDFFKATNIRKVAGLTGTPYRLESKWFADSYTGCIKMLNRVAKDSFFRNIVYKIELAELIEQNYLSPLVYHTYETDLSQLVVNSTGRDYTEDSLEKWGAQRIGKMMGMKHDLAKKHKRILVFCTSVAQATKGCESIRDSGMTAGVVSANTPKKERTVIVQDFLDGKIQWLFNVSVFTAGFDCPPLDAVVLLRPTFSVRLLYQCIGRAVRLDPDNPNKKAHIYDFTDNIRKFGPVEEIRLKKEDGWKDMLVGANGRIDNMELWRFDKNTQRYTEAGLAPKWEELEPEENEYITFFKKLQNNDATLSRGRT